MMEASGNSNLAMVKLSDMIRYLTSTGWQQVKFHDRRTLLFRKPDTHSERPFVVSLPANEEFLDYSAHIEEAIERLSIVEDSPFEAVLRRIRSVGQDVIYLRLAMTRSEYPSMERASHFIEGMRDLISWGACMEREQQPYFVQPFHEGRAQAEHFQLAHTYPGSFGFTIESQIPETYQPPIWAGYEALPLARRVLERITRGFLFTRQAERTQNTDEITGHFAEGFNGNMCKAVMNMLEDIRGGEVTYTVRWSTYLPASTDVAAFEPVVLKQDTVYYLQNAASYLEKSGQQDLEGQRTIEGQVTNLDYDGRGEHEVTMMAEGYGKVKFVLSEELYLLAGQAHLAGQAVKVTGKLVRRGQRELYTLTSPRDFQVVQ